MGRASKNKKSRRTTVVKAQATKAALENSVNPDLIMSLAVEHVVPQGYSTDQCTEALRLVAEDSRVQNLARMNTAIQDNADNRQRNADFSSENLQEMKDQVRNTSWKMLNQKYDELLHRGSKEYSLEVCSRVLYRTYLV